MESTSKVSTDPTGPNPSTLTKTTNNTFDRHESIGAQVRGLGVDQSRLEFANNLAYVDPEISSEPSAPPQDQVQPQQVQVNTVQMAPVVTLPSDTYSLGTFLHSSFSVKRAGFTSFCTIGLENDGHCSCCSSSAGCCQRLCSGGSFGSWIVMLCNGGT